MNKYPNIEETIEKEAVDWLSQFNEPPKYAFVAPQTFEALQFEYGLTTKCVTTGRNDTTLIPVLHTSIGSMYILPNHTISDLTVAFVSDKVDATYMDYIDLVAERILLGKDDV